MIATWTYKQGLKNLPNTLSCCKSLIRLGTRVTRLEIVASVEEMSGIVSATLETVSNVVFRAEEMSGIASATFETDSSGLGMTSPALGIKLSNPFSSESRLNLAGFWNDWSPPFSSNLYRHVATKVQPS